MGIDGFLSASFIYSESRLFFRAEIFVFNFLASFVRQCQASVAQPMRFFWAWAEAMLLN